VHNLGIRITRRFALILAVALLLIVDIGSGVHTIQELDVAHLDPLLHGLPNETIEDPLKLVPSAEADKTLLELGQR